ncbi:transcriptional regulator [Halodesulfurarchaeum formicicum]|uniref:Transcriptional regulator n=1 Tax=Halodesulfurarchaeum formicicum TaxID=1873524 RepID=A0A1D8S395_9EURY|nr:transcriptional regulator [Halodesulfurarchaeum formicicum]
MRTVEQQGKECTIELVTDDLDEYCQTIDNNDGVCTASACEDHNSSKLVRISAPRPDSCICTAFQEQDFTPQIQGYTKETVIITTTFSSRERFKSLVTDLKGLAEQVCVVRLQKVNLEEAEPQRHRVDTSTLTETQREFLQLALAKGYFESPREISQAELADELDISPSMVSRRVRAIEQRLFSQLETTLGFQ